MRLTSIDDAGDLELTIVGYEFPDAPIYSTERGTANWLEVDLKVRTPSTHGTSRVACMRTWDAASFADWLDALGSSESQVPSPFWLFPEPNLQLQLISQWPDRVAIQVYFILERPGAWETMVSPGLAAERNHYVGEIDMLVTRAELRVAAESLRTELRRFPVREVNT